MKNLFKILKFILTHPIGRKNKIKTLSRFFYWQIFSRLKIAKSIFNFVDDTKLYITSKQSIATGNFYVGLLEFTEMAFVSHFLNEKDTFFDIGTNIGTYTVIASGVCNATTYAFEPIPKTFNSLKKNIELNNLQNKVIALNIGLADINSFLDFTTGLDAKNHIVTTSKSVETIKVAVKKLDEFKQNTPALIKADVEGYEEFILKGADEILKQESLKAIIIEVNREGERYSISKNSIHEILTSYGFCMYGYKPFARELINIEKATSDNRIYIRDIEYVSEKLKQSPKIKVSGIYI